MTATVAKCEIMDGVLAVNKEAGWTSHDVVAKVRQVLGGAKVGHAGTLDPAATGLLPLLIGKGTRIAEYLVEWDKEYHAQLRLGETTDTLDATGTVLDRCSTQHLTQAAIIDAMGRFRGFIEQMPPMYSAVKIDGVPLYRSARAGKTVARAARTIEIRELDVLHAATTVRLAVKDKALMDQIIKASQELVAMEVSLDGRTITGFKLLKGD